MEISMIASVGKNGEIGKAGELIWHLHKDMVFFRETTIPHAIIMGRKTFESLPHALPGRQNIVLTKKTGYTAAGAQVASDKDAALRLCTGETAFIIGGAQLYGAFIDMASKLYLTEIDAECPAADTFFPPFDKSLYKRTVLATGEENGVTFRHVLYEKQ